MNKVCTSLLISPRPVRPWATAASSSPPPAHNLTVIHQERRAAVMVLKATLVFLVAYFGLLIAIVLPAIANEAPGKCPGLWRYLHMAPNWVTPGAACEINLDTLEQWTLADHAIQLVDPNASEVCNGGGIK
jgi:hypothetical protein